MKKLVCTLLAASVFVGITSVGAVAGIIFEDHFDGSTLGKVTNPSAINYVPGYEGQAAVITGPDGRIGYSGSLFPEMGSISLFVKAQPVTIGWQTILDTTGVAGPNHGDIAIELNNGTHVSFRMFDKINSRWNFIHSTTALSSTDYSNITVSYGNNGMDLYINGQLQGTNAFTQSFSRRDIYIGDWPTDEDQWQLGFTGCVDWLRVSDIQGDDSLTTVGAVPEPASIGALATGLFGLAGMWRRRKA